MSFGCTQDMTKQTNNSELASNNSSQELAKNFTTFSQWCENQDTLNPEAKKTVNKLLKYARTADCIALFC